MTDNFVNKEVCEIQMAHINATMDETKETMKNINTKLDNHMVNMAKDIASIKTVLETMSDRASNNIGTKAIGVVMTITIALIGIITSLIGKIR